MKFIKIIAILILFFATYKLIRELTWVRHDKIETKDFKISIRLDSDFIAFMDANVNKTIRIYNKKTKKRTKISFNSLEYQLFFFISKLGENKILRISDEFEGYNDYDYNTLKLLNKEDCFKEFGDCDCSRKNEIKDIFLFFNGSAFENK